MRPSCQPSWPRRATRRRAPATRRDKVVEARGAQEIRPGAPARRAPPGRPPNAGPDPQLRCAFPPPGSASGRRHRRRPRGPNAVHVAIVPRPDGPAWRRPARPSGPTRSACRRCAHGRPAAAPAPARLLRDAGLGAPHRDRAGRAPARPRTIAASRASDHQQTGARHHFAVAASGWCRRPGLEVAVGARPPAVAGASATT